MSRMKRPSNSFAYSPRRIRGDLITMFKITHGLLEFPMSSTFAHPTRKGQLDHAHRFHQQRWCTRRRQFAFTSRTAPFWNKLPVGLISTYFKDTPGCPRAAPVRRSTHRTHLLLQAIPPAYIDPRKKFTPK